MEIERKFLLSEAPQGLTAGQDIQQGYLTTGDPEVRLRRKGNKCFATQKGGSGLVRHELEQEIPDSLFQLLWPATQGKQISKTRHLVEGVDGLTWEVDVYQDSLIDLVVVEVELDLPEQDYQMPECIKQVMVKEVTKEARFKNKSLAVHGIAL